MLPGWSQGEIVMNGASIHYYRAGESRLGMVSGKPPVVLAHGFSDNGLSLYMDAVRAFLRGL